MMPLYTGQNHVHLLIFLIMVQTTVQEAINYLEAYGLEIGLLLNFGARRLQYKRVHNNKIIK